MVIAVLLDQVCVQGTERPVNDEGLEPPK